MRVRDFLSSLALSNETAHFLSIPALKQADEAFVKKQREYDQKNEEAARRQMRIQTRRLRSIQAKAEHIQMLRSRKQKCLQIEAGPVPCDAKHSSTDEQANASKETTTSRALMESKASAFDNPPRDGRRGLLVKSHSSPAVTMKCPHSRAPDAATMGSRLQMPRAAGGPTELLQFTKRRSKSGPGSPSRPYYCVRMSRSEDGKL